MDRILQRIGNTLHQAILLDDHNAQVRCLRQMDLIGQVVKKYGPRRGSRYITEIHKDPVSGSYPVKWWDLRDECLKLQRGVYGPNVQDEQGCCPWAADSNNITQLDREFLPLPGSLGGETIHVPFFDLSDMADIITIMNSVVWS